MPQHLPTQLPRPARAGRHVLLTGATGFVGGAVARVLAVHPDVELSVLVRRPARDPAARELFGDLTRPDSLAGHCQGIDTLVHAASYVGTDPERSAAVNDRGTAAILGEADRARVQRVIYISTAAVYGQGPHRDAEPEQLVPAPSSSASRTRLMGEHRVRAAGGVVLRPYLIYGLGDRWFIPGLVRLIRRLGSLPDADQVQLSTIAVDDLAGALAGLVTRTDALPPGTVLHANHPTPTRLYTMIDTVAQHTGLSLMNRDISRKHLSRESHANGRIERHHAMVSSDHWYASKRIWRLADRDPGAGFSEIFPRYAPWYRNELSRLDLLNQCIAAGYPDHRARPDTAAPD
jgi:2-alkyl-3-oxoalkanoate reductase